MRGREETTRELERAKGERDRRREERATADMRGEDARRAQMKGRAAARRHCRGAFKMRLDERDLKFRLPTRFVKQNSLY